LGTSPHMWPDFGKSVLMSHFTTKIFITKNWGMGASNQLESGYNL